MTTRSFFLSLFTGAAISTAAFTASAQDAGGPALRSPSAFPYFFGVTGGVGYATLSHPNVAQTLSGMGGEAVGFTAPAINLHAGYTIGERLSLGLEFSALEAGVSRENGTESFKLGYAPQAGCNNCHPSLIGGDVVAAQLVFSTLAARVEYSLLGRDGLFVGGSAGVAMLVGLEDKQGLGLTGRVGYRLRPTNVMTVALEAGVQGQIYGDTNIYMPYGAAVLRPYF
jgi:hypothetical protein